MSCPGRESLEGSAHARHPSIFRVKILRSATVRVAARSVRNRFVDFRPINRRAQVETGELPDFIVVGAMKAGTTSLAGNLKQHPRIFMPRREVRFFNEHWHEGVEWYRHHFADGAGKICGEKTPDYMRMGRFMERMHWVVPDAKIIVLLRDPVARLLSELNHRIQAGTVPHPGDRIDAPYLRRVILGDPLRRRRTLDRGFYLRQIRDNVLRYYPRECVLIRATDSSARAIDRGRLHASRLEGQLTGDDTSGTTLDLVNEVCGFLGVEPFPEETSLTVSGVRVYGAQVTRDAKQTLFDLYAEHNQALFDFLGYEILEWSQEFAVGD